MPREKINLMDDAPETETKAPPPAPVNKSSHVNIQNTWDTKRSITCDAGVIRYRETKRVTRREADILVAAGKATVV